MSAPSLKDPPRFSLNCKKVAMKSAKKGAYIRFSAHSAKVAALCKHWHDEVVRLERARAEDHAKALAYHATLMKLNEKLVKGADLAQQLHHFSTDMMHALSRPYE
jgi:hypothetical protein